MRPPTATASAQTAATFAREYSYYFVHGSTSNEDQFSPFGNDWTVSEDRIVLPLDGVEYFLPAPAEELDINGKVLADSAYQRKSKCEPLSGPLNFEAHHLAKLSCVLAGAYLVFAHTIPPQVFDGKIDSSFPKVGANVLPEICQLQRSTGEVRELLAFLIPVSAQIQHEVSNRIRRIAAISEQVLERMILGRGLVLAKCGQQIGKFMPRYFEFAHCACERNKYRMARRTSIAGIELGLPFIEQLQ